MCGYLYSSYTHVDKNRSHLRWKTSCSLPTLHSVLVSQHALAAGMPVLASCGSEFWVLYPDPGMFSSLLANISQSAANLPMFSVILEMDGGNKQTRRSNLREVALEKRTDCPLAYCCVQLAMLAEACGLVMSVQADRLLRKGGGRERE